MKLNVENRATTYESKNGGRWQNVRYAACIMDLCNIDLGPPKDE
jgi:hypothetical protein